MSKELIYRELKEEILFERYYYSSIKELGEKFKEIYEILYAAIQPDKKDNKELTLRQKNKLKEDILEKIDEAYAEFEDNSIKNLTEQFEYVKDLEEDDGTSIELLFLASVLGYTYYDMIKAKKQQYKTSISKEVNSSSASKSIIYGSGVLEQNRGLLRTLSKSGRETIKDRGKRSSEALKTIIKNEKARRAKEKSMLGDAEDVANILGWKSIAVLDSKTTDVCKRLNEEFYPISVYSSRSEIPSIPPRHFNCRSVLVPITKWENPPTISGVLKSDDTFARTVLGQNGFNLFKEGKKKINTIKDIYGNRFFSLNKIKEVLSND